MYDLKYEGQAIEDIEFHKKSGNLKLVGKINRMLDELEAHPKTGIGKPEQLKHNLAGKWSREINKKHRLVYNIEEKTVNIVNVISAKGHYTP